VGANEDIQPALAILLEAIAEELGANQDDLSVELETKAIRALLEAYRMGGDAVYKRTTLTPRPFPAPDLRQGRTIKPRPITKDFKDDD